MLERFIKGKSGPVALNTKVGYVLSGLIENSHQDESNSVMLTHVMKVQAEIIRSYNRIKDDFDKVWHEETIFKTDIAPNDDLGKDFDYKRFIEEKIKFKTEKKRFEIDFPFKDYHDLLAELRKTNEKFEQKLSKNEKLLQDFNDIFKEQLAHNIIQKISEDESEKRNDIGTVHYLPHHPVLKEERDKTKVRIVFDASSKPTGPSLNECLFPGPSITEPWFSILLCFRFDRIAMIADIEKAFLQIAVTEHRNFIRFLWYDVENINCNNILTAKLTPYRFCHLLFGVTSSMFILSATLQKHDMADKNTDPYFTEKLLKSLHVNGLNTGANSVQEGYCFYTKSKNVLSQGSFNLRKCQSNSTDLETLVHGYENDIAQENVKVFGVLWNKNSDENVFNFEKHLKLTKDIPTKRDLLSFSASIYDPLGLLNPFAFRLKALFQKVCVQKLLWEESLSDSLLTEWKVILLDLKVCESVKLLRWHGDYRNSDKVELQGFADASLKGYGCCVYVRFRRKDSLYHVSLVSTQSRVAPIRSQSIPKLELQAALLLTKLVDKVYKHLKIILTIKSITLYTDSTITLPWIRTTKNKLQPFVERRVNKIRELSDT